MAAINSGDSSALPNGRNLGFLTAAQFKSAFIALDSNGLTGGLKAYIATELKRLRAIELHPRSRSRTSQMAGAPSPLKLHNSRQLYRALTKAVRHRAGKLNLLMSSKGLIASR